MKRYYLLVFILAACLSSFGQKADSLKHRVIFIGDAGELDKQQSEVIKNALSKVLPGKTTVMYLGDNIYPRGMGLPGSKEEAATQGILRAQYQPFRSLRVPVYFTPGNHDWDRSGPKGLEKLKQQGRYLEAQGDTLLKLVPGDACPDPVAIPVGEDMVIIAFDSEWWLYPHSKENPEADCECHTKDEVITKLEELLYKNRYKTILLSSHHPFQSYGHHGGRFTFNDHLFPLTSISEKLYLPLPVLGSLYPLLRKVLANPEDLKHPLYRDMIKRIETVFDQFPNVVYVAGHEHGLQFIKNKNTQVVSGSGAKTNYVARAKDALFGSHLAGFVTADLMENRNVRFTYYTDTGSNFIPAFTYLKEYTSVKDIESAAYTSLKEDSLVIRVIPKFDEVGGFHRFILGENYRKEFAAPTKVPVIRISEFNGGLKPLQRGGGHQSKSLRLADKNGKEWVLRSVEKYPDVLVPEALGETFARDIVSDNMSAQNPFAALVVPPLADAVEVPHANPIIGVVAPEKELGIYGKVFGNIPALLEEREPEGKSDNTGKMMASLNKDNDNTLDKQAYLRARILDLWIGDWDRHPDQWRWAYQKEGKNKSYYAVPRDRDQVFYINRGLIPKIASQRWLLPYLQGFDGKIKNVNTYFWESRDMDARFLTALSYDEWMGITDKFVRKASDEVVETALKRLPASAYALRHNQLQKTLIERRAHLREAMETYYRFIHKVVDVQLSDKNEKVVLKDTADHHLSLKIWKINKEGKVKGLLYDKIFNPEITKEIRLYLRNGEDSLLVNNSTSPVKIRVIGGKGDKSYTIENSTKKINLYDIKERNSFAGRDAGKLRQHLSDDSLNTAYVPVNLYNVPMVIYDAGLNVDDGLLLGAGIKYTRQEGFRTTPFAAQHQLSVLHSFSTSAFRINYRGEWQKVAGNADITLTAEARAPNNTMNFFGRGNETQFNKTGDYKRYYRSRFSLYTIDPALRWKYNINSSLSVGPSLQYYSYSSRENSGRFITNTDKIGSYDSITIDKSKLFAGITFNYINDNRNNRLLPQWGNYISLNIKGYTGLNTYSKSFVQFTPEIALFTNLNARATLVLAERFGGTVTLGKTAFYQSAFLGGQGNLLGYRQYRFAGQHSFYNNLELRAKLADFANYILPGQLGMLGFYDAGRVWEKNEHSSKWHQGVGGGLYFAPAQLAVLKFVMGKSGEGWYPYLTIQMRF